MTDLQLATATWLWFQPDWGVPVRITIGAPRVDFPYEDMRVLAPWELRRGGQWADLPDEDQRRIYRHRLHRMQRPILDRLTELTECYPGVPLVLCCFEPPWGQCHRFWLAEWMHQKLDVEVPELVPENVLAALTSTSSGRLPPEDKAPKITKEVPTTH